MEGAGWNSVIANVVNIGFSALVGWYLLTQAMPRMLKEFGEELRNQRKELSDLYNVLRADSKESLGVVVAHCEKEAARNSELLAREIGSMGDIIRDNQQTMEEVRSVMVQVRTYFEKSGS